MLNGGQVRSRLSTTHQHMQGPVERLILRHVVGSDEERNDAPVEDAWDTGVLGMEIGRECRYDGSHYCSILSVYLGGIGSHYLLPRFWKTVMCTFLVYFALLYLYTCRLPVRGLIV